MKNIYRPEIDGLRALAVLPVIFYHAGISLFKGGFIGVDIFFVISGFLITTIILKDVERNKFSLIYFYQRRAKRILPALITIIFFSLSAALFLLPPDDLKNFSGSVISSLTFWSNFQFTNETSYFGIPGEYKPLLHTWSLSIEEQFYIFYPLFFIFFFKFKKKFLKFSIFIIFLSSLFFAQWSGNLNQQYPYIDENLLFFSQSYFSQFMMPFGRMWELALGAICVFILNSKNFKIKLINKFNLYLNLLSLIGLTLIFYSFFFFSKYLPYPSFYSLIPTLGTALLILFCHKNTIIYKILSNKFLVFIGLISYSAYLFHYPIFSFIKHMNINLNNVDYFYLIPIVFFLSFLSWRFIEKPFRKSNFSTKKFILFVSFSYFILISTCWIIYSNNGLENRQKFNLPKNITESFVVSKEASKCFGINYIHKIENKEKICKIGIKNKNKIDFVILGDSHINSFYSLFNKSAKENNKLGLFLGYPGCPPILNVYPLRADQKEKDCYELNQSVFKIINEKNIKNLVLISRWTYYTDGNYNGNDLSFLNLKPSRSSNKTLSRQAFEKGIKDTLKSYSEIGTNIFIIEQAPHQTSDPKKVYYRSFDKNTKKFNENLMKYSLDLNKHNNLQHFVKSLFKKYENKYKNLTLINLDNVFCNSLSKKCLVGNEQYSFYVNDNHLSTNGANLSTKKIKKLIKLF
tara:strand:+ start:90 stop:2153 length:2064 start_codon:yes stop_codon:yes gene_type:complete